MKKKRTKRKCQHRHPYGVYGHSLWCPTCGAIMFSPRSCEMYLRSEWTLPTHNPKVAPKTVWHDDVKKAG